MKSEKAKGTKKSYRLYIFAAFLAVIMALSCVAIVALDNNDASATTSTYDSSTKTLVLGTDVTVIDETRDINPGSAYYVNNNGAVTLTMRATPAPTMETPVVVFINSEGPKVTFVNEYVSDFNNADPDTNFDHAAVFVVYIVDSHDGTTSITLANGLKSDNLDGDNFIVGEAIYGSTNAGDARVTCRNPETMSFMAYNGHVYYAGDFDTESQESYFCGEGDVQLFGPPHDDWSYPSTDLCNVNFYDKTGTFKGDAHWESGPGANQAYDIFDLESFTGSFSQINRIVTIESWVGGDLNITRAPEAYKVVLKAGLTIPAGSTLTIGDGTYVDVAGAVTNSGRIVNNGTISNSANISGNAVMTPSTYAGKTLTLSNDIEVVTASQSVLPGGAYYVNNSSEVTLTLGATPAPSMDAPVIIFINKEAPLVTLVNEYVSDFNNAYPETNFKHAAVFVIYMVDSHDGVTSITLLNGLKADNLDGSNFKVGTAVYDVDDVGDGTTTMRRASTSSYRVFNGNLYRQGNFSNGGLVGYYCGESNVQQYGPYVGNAYPSTELSTSNFYEMTGTFKGDAHWEEGPGADQAYDIFALDNFTGVLTQINRVVTIDTWTGGDITITKGAEGYAVILKAGLTIPAGSTLTVNEGVYADAKATVTNNGTIVNHGTIANPENITGNPVVTPSIYDAGTKELTLGSDIEVVTSSQNVTLGHAYFVDSENAVTLTIPNTGAGTASMRTPVIIFVKEGGPGVTVVNECVTAFDPNTGQPFEEAIVYAVYMVQSVNGNVLTLRYGLTEDNIDGDYFKVGEGVYGVNTIGDARTWLRGPATGTYYVNNGHFYREGNNNNTGLNGYYTGNSNVQEFYLAEHPSETEAIVTIDLWNFTGTFKGDAHWEEVAGANQTYTDFTLTSFTGILKVQNRIVTIDTWTSGSIEITKADSTHAVILKDGLTIPAGSSLVVGNEVNVTLAGSITNNGTFLNPIAFDLVNAGSSWKDAAPESYNYGAGMALPTAEDINVYTKDGFTVTFDGWYVSDPAVLVTNVPVDAFGLVSYTAKYTETPLTYTVTLPGTQTGYTLAAKEGSQSPVAYGGSYTFTFALDPGYSQSTPVIKVNDVVVVLSEGEYTITNITADQVVTVEDVSINQYTVTYVITNGGSIEAGVVNYHAAFESETINPNDHYVLPENVTVTMGEAEFTQFTFANGKVTIAADKIEGNLVITAVCVKETYAITLAVDGEGYGTITPTSIVNQPYGATYTVNGATLTVGGNAIVATPTDDDEQYDYNFIGWYIGDTPVSASYISGATTFTAKFTRTVVTYAITLAVDGEGYGTITPTSIGAQAYGTDYSVTDNVLTIGETAITATPAADTAQYTYAFDGWYIGENKITAASTITGATTFTAKFTKTVKCYTLEVNSSNGSYGSVKLDEEAAGASVVIANIPYNTEISILNDSLSVKDKDNVTHVVMAIAADASTQWQYSFVQFDKETGTKITGNMTVVAEFSRSVREYNVTIDSEIQNGTVEASPASGAAGTEVTLTIAPASGYQLKEGSLVVTGTGGAVTVTNYKFEIPAYDVTVTAEFEEIPSVLYNAYVNANNGTTDKSEAMEINPATTPTVTLPAASAFSQWTKTGYHMVGYATTATGTKTLDFGQTVPVADVIAIADADHNVNIYVVWEIDTFAVTIVSNDNEYGTVAPAAIADVPYDSVISVSGNTITINGTTVTATPATETDEYRYSFASWSVNDGDKVTSALEITATFERAKQSYSVTLDLGIGGKFASTPAGFEKVSDEAYIGWFEYGTEVNVTEIPTKDPTAEFEYTFSHWNVAFPITVTETSMTIALYDEATREYTVSFSVDGNGTVAPASVANVPYGSAFTVSDNTVTIIGTTVTVTVGADVEKYTYSFGGWNIKNGDTVAGDTAVVATVVEITKPETTETAVEFISDSDDKTVTASVDDIKSSDKENVVIGKDVESTSDAANWSVEIPKSYFSDKTENVSVTVTDVSADLPDVISDDQKKKLEGMTVISLDMIIGEKTEHQFGTKVTVKLAYTLKAGQSADNLFVYYVNTESGQLEKYDVTYADGFITFETDHFSFWAVGEDNGSSSPVNDGLFLASLLVAAIILPIIAGLVIFRKK